MKHSYYLELSESQKYRINKKGEAWLKDAKNYGPHAEAIATRMALIRHRICMVLSIKDHFDKGLAEGKVQCPEEYFLQH